MPDGGENLRNGAEILQKADVRATIDTELVKCSSV